MNRRDFLTAILGSTTAALVLQQTALAVAITPDSREATIAREWQLSYRAVHEQALQQLETAMLRHGQTYPHWLQNGVRFGEEFSDGTLCADQFNVSTGTNYDLQGTLEPAMTNLAYRIVEQGLDRFTSLPSDFAGPEYADTLVGLRMIVQYDIAWDRLLTRFDVCGGVSAASQARLVRRDRERLKDAIRRRIAAYHRSERSGHEVIRWD